MRHRRQDFRISRQSRSHSEPGLSLERTGLREWRTTNEELKNEMNWRRNERLLTWRTGEAVGGARAQHEAPQLAVGTGGTRRIAAMDNAIKHQSPTQCQPKL